MPRPVGALSAMPCRSLSLVLCLPYPITPCLSFCLPCPVAPLVFLCLPCLVPIYLSRCQTVYLVCHAYLPPSLWLIKCHTLFPSSLSDCLSLSTMPNHPVSPFLCLPALSPFSYYLFPSTMYCHPHLFSFLCPPCSIAPHSLYLFLCLSFPVASICLRLWEIAPCVLCPFCL